MTLLYLVFSVLQTAVTVLQWDMVLTYPGHGSGVAWWMTAVTAALWVVAIARVRRDERKGEE